jgi:PAS domain S-box-containing protein
MTDGPEARSSELQISLLVESVGDYAIFILDAGGHIATWNRGAERLKGYRADEIIGQHFSTFYTAEDRERGHPDHELQVAIRDGRFEEEGWRIRKDGSRFWASVVITALRDSGGKHIGFGKVTRDLTARRLGEEQLRATAAELQTANAQLEQFRRLVVSVRDYAIFMLDPGGHVVTWNVGAENIKGYAAEEIIGRHFSAFYTTEDRERGHPAHELELAAREGRFEEEGWRVRKDGTTFWAAVTITAMRNDDGMLDGYAKVTRDLTMRRAAEEALRAANEELDRFASLAAHDMSDPLRTIAGFAELLEKEELGPPATEWISHIVTTSDRMRRLLDSLLTFARAGEDAYPPGPVELRTTAVSVLASLAGAVRETGAEIIMRLPEEAVVWATTHDVELLLQNLVSNALKFGDSARPRVEIAAEPDGESWRLVVADNGLGIAHGDHERIFGAFERAHAEDGHHGSGLGLAICERVVHRHGGTIGVESTPGQGSRFWVLLPSPTATA